MEDEILVVVEPADEALPAPKPASRHVAQLIDILPRPHEDLSDDGVPHPSHRAG